MFRYPVSPGRPAPARRPLLSVLASALVVGALLAAPHPALAQTIKFNYSGNVVASPDGGPNYTQEYVPAVSFMDTAAIPRGWSVTSLYPQPMDAGGDPNSGPTSPNGPPGFQAKLDAQYGGTYNFQYGGAGLSTGSLYINRYAVFAGNTPLRRDGGNNPFPDTFGEDIIVNYTAPLAGQQFFDPTGAATHWIQVIYTNIKAGNPDLPGTIDNKVDVAGAQADPYYDTNGAAAIFNARDANGSFGYFVDEPFRDISAMSTADNTQVYFWTAELRLARDLGTQTNGKEDIQVYSNGIRYGFIVAAAPDGSTLFLFGSALPILGGFLKRRRK